MISAILLAAGKSKRMGKKNKLVKEIKGKPLIKHALENILSSSVDELIIVLGYQEKIIRSVIEKNSKIKIVYNKDFDSGMASSIKTGLQHISKKNNFFFICLADMPLVNTKIYDDLIKNKKKNEIIIPTFNGLQGNPILFSKTMKNKLMAINGDAGAKKILEMFKEKIFNLETNDKSVVQDFDTEENFN